MRRITSIIFSQTSWALQPSDSDSEHRLKIYRKGQIIHSIYNNVEKEAQREYFYKVVKLDMELFFDFLEEKIRIQEWRDDYSVEVNDGYCWVVKVRYSDHRIKNHSGTVELPPQGNELEKRILGLVKFDEKPWIF